MKSKSAKNLHKFKIKCKISSMKKILCCPRKRKNVKLFSHAPNLMHDPENHLLIDILFTISKCHCSEIGQGCAIGAIHSIGHVKATN